MTKRETVAALLGKLNGTFEQWNDGDADVENSLFIDLYDTLRALAEFALSLDEQMGEHVFKHDAPREADAPPEAQPQRRLKDGYAIDWDPDGVQRCVYSCDIRGTPAQIVGPVGSPEVERCYEDPQNKPFCDTTTGADTDSTANAAQDGDSAYIPDYREEGDRCFHCDAEMKEEGKFVEVCEKCMKRDAAQDGDTLELKEGDEVLIRWNGLNRYRVVHNVIHSVHPPCWSLQQVYKKRDDAQEVGE